MTGMVKKAKITPARSKKKPGHMLHETMLAYKRAALAGLLDPLDHAVASILIAVVNAILTDRDLKHLRRWARTADNYVKKVGEPTSESLGRIRRIVDLSTSKGETLRDTVKMIGEDKYRSWDERAKVALAIMHLTPGSSPFEEGQTRDRVMKFTTMVKAAEAAIVKRRERRGKISDEDFVTECLVACGFKRSDAQRAMNDAFRADTRGSNGQGS